MHVLKENHLNKDVGFKVICKGDGELSCGSILLIGLEDVKEYGGPDISGVVSWDYYITCPICGKDTTINKYEVFKQAPVSFRKKK